MMKTKLFQRLCLTLVCLATPIGAHANLISNGGFEDPGFAPGPPGYVHRTGADLTDWSIVTSLAGIVHFNSDYRPVDQGIYSIQFEGPGDSISQSFATSIGTLYRVSFDLSAHPAGSPALLQVSVTGALPLVFAGLDTGYTPYSYDFVATATTSTLDFTSTQQFPHLDNVSVASVPDSGPGTLGLAVLVGLLAIHQMMRKSDRTLKSQEPR